MKINLKTQLKNYYSDIPLMPNSQGKQVTVMKAQHLLSLQVNNDNMTFFQFFLSQLRFIRKSAWVIQFIIVLLYSCSLFNLVGNAEGIMLLSPISPLIVVFSMFELSRSYVQGTIEIELSMKFSFKQLMLVRISITGISDVFFLTLILFISKLQLSMTINALILYLFVPFLITAFGCLWSINHFSDEKCNYCCIVLGLFISIILWIAIKQFPQIYETSALGIWVIIFLIALTGVILELCKMLKHCDQKLDAVH